MLASLDLDLRVFQGPFDLLLALVLREEGGMLEVHLAETVLTYIDRLESTGQLDLEAATEFLVLIAALLELKSRMLLPREDDDLLDLEPGEAAEEVLAAMLEARRYRAAAEHLAERLAGEHGVRYRQAPLPKWLRAITVEELGEAVYSPDRLGKAIGDLLLYPPAVFLSHLTIARVP